MIFREFLATFLWAYRTDRRRFFTNLGGLLVVFLASCLIVIIATFAATWGWP